LKIVTHNALWFQGAPFPTDEPGPAVPEVLAALAAAYRRLRPDVLAIQEVQDEATFRCLGEAVGLPGRYCPGGELPAYGGAIFHGGGRHVADGRSSRPVPQRMWQAVQVPFTEGRGLMVCSVHLPSSRQLGPGAAQRRLNELRAALGHLRPPAVVLGDFNEPPGGAVGSLLARSGYLDAAVIAGRADVPTALGGGRGDQAWVHRGLRAALQGYGVMDRRELAAAPAGRECLSDHFPVWIELEG
jgi:endonuclease/exonuclease/phosphatase family metal-dependent hydrolase